MLSFFDAENYCQTALTVVNPTDDWTKANRVDYALGQDFPQLYGGFIHPASRLNEPNGMRFAVSQCRVRDKKWAEAKIHVGGCNALPQVR